MEGEEEREMQKELSCVMYLYRLPTRKMSITYYNA